MKNCQTQLGGRDNTQIIINQEIAKSFSGILVNMANSLKKRSFKSVDVRDHFVSRIDEITKLLNESHENTLKNSRFMVYPFEAIPVPENLQDQGYICSMLDALSVIAFTEPVFEIRPNHINIKIAGKNIYGIYYTTGKPDLKDSYVRLLRSMEESRIPLPPGFVCIPLDVSGDYTPLKESKINNIVTNIVGDSEYIKPLQTGTPKCLSLSSYIISEAQNLLEARKHVREVLGLE